MSNQIEEKFEDRYGSDFEEGQGASEEKLQNRKYGIKSSDSLFDKIKKMKQKGELKEEDSAPKQEPDNEEDDEDKKDEKISDAENEKRIEMMQYMNPRILKSKDKKQYMTRANIQEDIIARLNELASHKLDLFKAAIALNIPRELDEERKPKVVPFVGYGNEPGWKASNPYTKKVQYFGSKFKDKAIEFANKGAPQSAAEIVADHETLHKLNEEAEQLDNEHPTAVIKFASDAHEQWRMGFDPERTGKERIKKNSDGSEGNINVPFHELHPDWQKENLAAGYAARDALLAHPNDIEKASEHVHNEWMKRNPKADYNAHQHVPYNDLPEDEKQKDRDHVIKMQGLISLSEANRNVMRQGRTSVVKVRIRGGKVQRRKRISAVKGYTMRGGKLKRMTAQERMRRKRSQRRAAVKRRAKQARALMRRKRSMRRRSSLGLKE